VTGEWHGSRVRAARAYWAGRLPYPCHVCGHPVYPWQPWHVGHLVPRKLGGPVDDPDNLAPAHAGCNLTLGARIVPTATTPTGYPPPSRRW